MAKIQGLCVNHTSRELVVLAAVAWTRKTSKNTFRIWPTAIIIPRSTIGTRPSSRRRKGPSRPRRRLVKQSQPDNWLLTCQVREDCRPPAFRHASLRGKARGADWPRRRSLAHARALKDVYAVS